MVIRSLELTTIAYLFGYFLKRSNAGEKIRKKFSDWNWLHHPLPWLPALGIYYQLLDECSRGKDVWKFILRKQKVNSNLGVVLSEGVLSSLTISQDVRSLMPRTCEYVLLHGRGDLADAIKVRDCELGK